MNAKMELLSGVPLFQGLSKRQLEHVATLADEIDLPADRELTQEGASGKEFLVLVDGVADVTRNGELINTLGPGDFLGEISLVTGWPRTATVTTRTASRVLVLSAPGFRALLHRMPRIQSKVLDALVLRAGI
jgi:CRP-like cAMP-binding protein